MDETRTAPPYLRRYDTLLYRVKPGDTLTKIIRHYHPHADQSDIPELIAYVVDENPLVSNPDLIMPDQLIHLPIPVHFHARPDPYRSLKTVRTEDLSWISDFEKKWKNETPEGRNLLATLMPGLLSVGSSKLTSIDVTFRTNTSLLADMVKNYEAYKSNKKTKGQYDYRRKTLVNQLTRNLGPTNLILNGNRPPTEVLRISTSKGAVPTAPISIQSNKMYQVSRLAKSGGVALSVVGLGMSCSEISKAKSREDKNEIFVQSAGGLIGGVLYGLGTTIAVGLMATPVGWVGALVIGAGSFAAGYIGGKSAITYYDVRGKEFDFVAATRVDNVCRPGTSSRAGETPTFSNATLSAL